jgi:hypothetical protein
VAAQLAASQEGLSSMRERERNISAYVLRIYIRLPCYSVVVADMSYIRHHPKRTMGCGKDKHGIGVISFGYCCWRGLITEFSGLNSTFCVHKTLLLSPRRSDDINAVFDCTADPMQLRVLLSASCDMRGEIHCPLLSVV